ncbi:pleckstrin-2-like isoform X3 [Porites lutea]|uniref:pleckstrin-2-like isoform X3 n=1 Tax=Porites lutea TaxID=51062 RepID=UPI003CC511D2
MDSEEPRKLKEGFLVKKGHVRHNWKTRWFILYDETLVYCKKKNQIMQATGEIPLQGCFLVSPCAEYTKKEAVFRITSKDNVEYLVQAANDEEREEWTTAIANAIRRLDIKYKHTKSEVPHSRSTYSRPALQFPPTQIRDAGRDLACVLLEDAHLQPVGLTSTLSFKQKTEFENAATFLDDTDALYRFSALRHSAQNEPLELETSDDSSDSEDEIPRDQCGAIKGNIVKQGFLQKKGHVRHNWKTRKFILCTEPTMLFYCRPSKESTLVGQIKLLNSEVKTLKNDDDLAGAEWDQGNKKQTTGYTFLLRTRKGIKYIFRAASEEDRMDWVQALQSVCENT